MNHYPFPNHRLPGPDRPFVLLAGPDVIEGDGSLNQETAQVLKEITQRLGITFYFKSSYDKANRTSHQAYRGPGVEEGLAILNRIKQEEGVALLTDIHSPEEAAQAGKIVDCVQVPAFLSRQTDLLIAAGQTGKLVNLKKGQFLSPRDVIHAVDKVRSTGNNQIYVCERGTTFGYNNLVVDMRCFPIVHEAGYPIIFDATHSVQLPGGSGTASSGERQFVITLARAAVAAGCDGLFIETHPDPDKAPCDGPNMIPLSWVEPLLESLLAIRQTVERSTIPVPC